MPRIPSRLPREQEIPSPDRGQGYTAVVTAVLRHSNVLHLHQQARQNNVDTIVRTSRFTEKGGTRVKRNRVRRNRGQAEQKKMKKMKNEK